ncbi:MAG: hypothetical protein ACXVMS_03700 [Flavisolibacter sp.]
MIFANELAQYSVVSLRLLIRHRTQPYLAAPGKIVPFIHLKSDANAKKNFIPIAGYQATKACLCPCAQAEWKNAPKKY